MVGRITLIAVLTLVTIYVALPTSAQDESTGPVRRSPLSERLKQFRNEIFGEMPRRDGPTARPSRKMIRRAQPTQAAPVEVEPGVEARAQDSPAVTQHPYVRVPSYLETQGARPAARGTSRRTAPPLDGATQSLRSKMGPLRRSAEEARSRSGDLDVEQDELQGEPSPDQDGNDQEEVRAESTAADPYVPQTALSDDSDHYGDSEVEATDEPAQRGEPRVARGVREPLARGSEESPEHHEQPLDEPAGSLDEAAQPLDEPARSLDRPAESLDEADSSDVLFTSRSPVLSVKASGPRTVLIGSEVEFVVNVRNDGTAANNVVVSINIPSDADVGVVQPTAGNAQAAGGGDRHDVIEWTIDRLETDSSETLTLKLVPRNNSPLDLAVSLTFTPETSRTVVEVQEPKLTMSLSGPTEVLYGQTKIYKLSISNPGNGDTHNVTVGLVPLGRSGEAAVNHALGTLKAGESKTIDIELTARQAGAVTIKAHAFADGGLRAEAAEQVLVRRASLQVEVEAPRIRYAGTAGTFHVKVENTGDVAAENVQVSAMLPPESKFIAASSGGRHEPQRAQVNWTVGSLQPGGRRVFELRCALSAPGENRMQFAAAADGDVSAAATSNTRVEAIADLKLEVNDPQGPIAVSDEAVYEIRIRNRGTKAAEGVDLDVFFSEGLEATAADGGPHDIGSGQVIFRPIETLEAGDTAVFRIRARADAAGNHVFRAEVTCRSLGTKLATEEATHFYGERRAAADPGREPTLATPPEDLPTPARAESDHQPSDEPLSE